MKVWSHLRHPERLFALLLIGWSLTMYMLTGKLEQPVEPGAIAASTFPLLILAAITLICCFIILRPAQDEEVTAPMSIKGVPIIILTTVYIALIEPLGFFVVTPLFLFIQPLFENFRRYRMLTFSVVLTSISVYLLFVHVLAIPLPAGILGE